MAFLMHQKGQRALTCLPMRLCCFYTEGYMQLTIGCEHICATMRTAAVSFVAVIFGALSLSALPEKGTPAPPWIPCSYYKLPQERGQTGQA